MIERGCKAVLVAAIGLYMTIVALNNVIDYDSNFQFVKHVLSMDSTFPGNKLMGRALTAPAVHCVFYAGIIAWEWASAALAWAAAFRLWMAGRDSARASSSVRFATLAITFNLMLWLVGFLSVGGEWFVMWQSSTWNGQTAAFRMFAIFAAILIIVRQPDPSEHGLDASKA
jgi:predicted small integral membrane protein